MKSCYAWTKLQWSGLCLHFLSRSIVNGITLLWKVALISKYSWYFHMIFWHPKPRMQVASWNVVDLVTKAFQWIWFTHCKVMSVSSFLFLLTWSTSVQKKGPLCDLRAPFVLLQFSITVVETPVLLNECCPSTFGHSVGDWQDTRHLSGPAPLLLAF